MAKQIKGNDIIENNHLDNAIKSGEQLLKVYKELDAQMQKTAKTAKTGLGNIDGKSAKGIRDLNQALSESEKKKAAALKIDKERARLEVKLKALNSDKIQQNEQLKVLASEQAKNNKQLARETLGLVGAYERESKLLIKLRKELKDLIITEGEGSKKTKELAQRVTELDGRLKKADAAAGQFQRNVGNYPTALKGAIGSLKKLAGALGIFGGIQLAIRGIRNMFNVVKNFDQATADLASILGTTTDQMSELTDQAKELGATTIFTAAQVSELQKEYAKLGFTQEQIQGVTEATLQLAAATNSDLGTSATVVGSTLRAFGLDVSETQRVVDVMAKSFSSSSLDMEKFTVAMRAVAPVAKNAGFSIEETTALIGTLTDAGIDASTAGTGLRNVFLELSKQGLTFEQAMSEINSATDKNAKSLELFGKRGAVIGTVLAESGVSADALTEKLENAGGAAEEMADKQLNTLGGAVKLLVSAWEGFILKLNDSSGAGATLTKIIRFLAENLETIINTVINLGKVFVAYKAGIKAATLATRAFGEAGRKASKFFGGPMLAAISLVVLAVGELIDAYGNAAEAGASLEDVTDKVNEKMVEEKAKLELVRVELAKTTAGSKERQEVLNKINAEYGTTLQNLEDEAEFANQVADAYNRVVESLRKEIEVTVVKDALIEYNKELLKIEMLQKRAREAGEEGNIVYKANEEAIKFLNGEIRLLEQRLLAVDETIVKGKGNAKELSDRFSETSKEVSNLSGELKKLNTDLEDPLAGIIDEDKSADFEAFKRGLKQSTREIEIELRARGASEEEIKKALREKELQDLKDIRKRALEDFGENSQLFLDADLAVRREIAKRNKEQEDEEQAARDRQKKADRKQKEALLDQAKEFAQKQTDILNDLADARIRKIDDEINARKEDIAASDDEISRLRALGTAEANEAIKAERIAQAKNKTEVEQLEKKKRDLLLQIAVLNKANLLFQQSDVDGFEKAIQSAKDFKDKLPSFYGGTEGTVAEALGRTGTRDGHTVNVHDNEHIIGAKDSDKLHAAGLTKNKDIVESALAYQNQSVNKRALNARTILSDTRIVDRLDRVEKAITNFKPVKVVQQHIDIASGKEVLIDGNKKTINNHNPRSFRI